MKILVTDDHKLIVADIIREISMLKPDAECTGCYSSLDALELGKKEQFDLAILDIDMPLMDGLTLAKKLQELQPNINIVFATGYPEYALQAYDVLASSFLVKPVTAKDLQKAFDTLRHPVYSDDFATDYYLGSDKLGEKIKNRRMAKNLTVKDVADKMMVSPQAVYRWESGERMPDIVTFLSLVRMFGISVEEMLKD